MGNVRCSHHRDVHSMRMKNHFSVLCSSLYHRSATMIRKIMRTMILSLSNGNPFRKDLRPYSEISTNKKSLSSDSSPIQKIPLIRKGILFFLVPKMGLGRSSGRDPPLLVLEMPSGISRGNHSDSSPIQKIPLLRKGILFFLVPKMGLEPTHPKAYAPQTYVSTIPPPGLISEKRVVSMTRDSELRQIWNQYFVRNYC